MELGPGFKAPDPNAYDFQVRNMNGGSTGRDTERRDPASLLIKNASNWPVLTFLWRPLIFHDTHTGCCNCTGVP